MIPRASRLLLASVLFAACGDDTTNPTTDSSATTDTSADVTGVDAPGAETVAPAIPADLGQSCAFGCNLQTCVDRDSACESLCLYDGRTQPFQVYCSMPCDDTPCPAGWTCINPADAEFDGVEAKVCAALPAECGNNIVERGEVCDDGNRDDGDSCAANCDRIPLPTTSGRVTMRINGGDPFTFEGAKEGGFAFVDAQGNLRWSEVNAVEGFGFSMSGIGDRTSAAGNQIVELSMTPFPCNFGGTTFATLSAFNAETSHIAGSFTALVACFGGCFDCGGDGSERTIEVDFDLTWLDRPDL